MIPGGELRRRSPINRRLDCAHAGSLAKDLDHSIRATAWPPRYRDGGCWRVGQGMVRFQNHKSSRTGSRGIALGRNDRVGAEIEAVAGDQLDYSIDLAGRVRLDQS